MRWNTSRGLPPGAYRASLLPRSHATSTGGDVIVWAQGITIYERDWCVLVDPLAYFGGDLGVRDAALRSVHGAPGIRGIYPVPPSPFDLDPVYAAKLSAIPERDPSAFRRLYLGDWEHPERSNP